MYHAGDASMANDQTVDAREDDYSRHGAAIILPHSCDEWVVGTAVEARLMAQELLNLAREWERYYGVETDLRREVRLETERMNKQARTAYDPGDYEYDPFYDDYGDHK